MMLASQNDAVRVNVVKDLTQAVFPASCFSILNIPDDSAEANAIFRNLYNSPSPRHLVMAFCRHPKKYSLRALANVFVVEDRTPWEYLDTVHVWYEKPSSSSNTAFLPITEEAYLFYKGSPPNIDKTKWFSGDNSPNATNLWNVSVQPKEDKQFSYYRKFTWEIPLILISMMTPLETRRFIYAPDWEKTPNYESLFKFCQERGMQVQLYAPDAEQARQIVDKYEAFIGANL